MARISSSGELYADRPLRRDPGDETRYAPGQYDVRILDPGSKRDRSDLGALLTWVDEDGLACVVICERNRSTGEWVGMGSRYGVRRTKGRAPLALLDDVGRKELIAAANGVEPFPFAPAPPAELRMRHLVDAFVSQVMSEGGEDRG